jgi:hypothetical protein
MRRQIILAVLLIALVGAAPAAASTLVYQCGPGVCAIDPDAGGAPRTLTPDGTVAGITRDGVTASWVDANRVLVQAPVAGGTPTPVYTKSIGFQPNMSPDGTQYLWWQLGPSVLGGFGDVYIYRSVVGTDDSQGVSVCVSCVTSHGWIGANTPIAAFPLGESSPSEICRIESGPGSSCVQKLASEPRGGVGFPTGSPDGTQIAAALAVGKETGTEGAIVLYSTATGAAIADVTPGPADTSPTWSPDGKRLAFDRGENEIVVRDLASGAERVVANGHTAFWGGPTTPPTATLTASKSRKVSSWKTLKGSVAGAAAVEVSMYRRSGSRCVAWSGKAFRSTSSCSKAPWVKATVSGGSWSLKLKGLKDGRYTVRVRALDSANKAGKTASKTVTLS